MNKPVSASHLKLWKLCKRKERFTYGQGLREAPNAAAMAGTKVHSLMEEWGITGEKPPSELLWDNYDLGRMAWALSEHLPERSKLRAFEEKFEIDLYGVRFGGIIDLQTDDAVWDYKTTSKLLYVKSNEELELDEQRLLYLTAKPDRTHTNWLYGVWADYSAHVRSLRVDPVADRERFKLHVLRPAEELLSVPTGTDPLSLEPNPDACKLYPPNGCPFKSKCFPVNKTAQRMTKLMDRLREKEAAQAASAAGREPTIVGIGNNDLINGPGTAKQDFTQDSKAEEPVVKMESDEKPIEFLFVDAFPVSGFDGSSVVSASVLISAASASVADDNHVPNALLIDFGKGPPMIAAQLSSDLKGKSYKYVYLETKSAEGRAVLQVMMNAARFVVKGMI